MVVDNDTGAREVYPALSSGVAAHVPDAYAYYAAAILSRNARLIDSIKLVKPRYLCTDRDIVSHIDSVISEASFMFGKSFLLGTLTHPVELNEYVLALETFSGVAERVKNYVMIAGAKVEVYAADVGFYYYDSEEVPTSLTTEQEKEIISESSEKGQGSYTARLLNKFGMNSMFRTEFMRQRPYYIRNFVENYKEMITFARSDVVLQRIREYLPSHLARLVCASDNLGSMYLTLVEEVNSHIMRDRMSIVKTIETATLRKNANVDDYLKFTGKVKRALITMRRLDKIAYDKSFEFGESTWDRTIIFLTLDWFTRHVPAPFPDKFIEWRKNAARELQIEGCNGISEFVATLDGWINDKLDGFSVGYTQSKSRKSRKKGSRRKEKIAREYL